MDKDTIRKIAEETSALLRESGWAQRFFISPDGGMCLAVAMSWAAERTSPEPWREGYVAVAEAARPVIWDLFPGRGCTVLTCTGLYPCDVICFNDHPSTTADDVHLVLKHLAGK